MFRYFFPFVYFLGELGGVCDRSTSFLWQDIRQIWQNVRRGYEVRKSVSVIEEMTRSIIPK